MGDLFILMEKIDEFIAESKWTVFILHLNTHYLLKSRTKNNRIIFQIVGYASSARETYSTLNEKTERMSKLIGSYFVKLQIIPQATILFFRAILNYYVFDLGEDSFELPLQVVYV